jgi:hypothetical protein
MEQLTRETDAYRACLATILELELEQVPEFEGMAADLQFQAWLATDLNMATLRLEVLSPVPPILWLARVHSPYPLYKVHTVVMQQALIAFDPHPEPQPVDLSSAVIQCEVFVPMDPSAPSGHFAL